MASAAGMDGDERAVIEYVCGRGGWFPAEQADDFLEFWRKLERVWAARPAVAVPRAPPPPPRPPPPPPRPPPPPCAARAEPLDAETIRARVRALALPTGPYAPEHRLCFELRPPRWRTPPQLARAETLASAVRAAHLYEDFAQRGALLELRALHASRRALPIAAAEAALFSALRTSRALIVEGATGCGKSTQLPQMLLARGFSRVVVTQPRRLAAVSLAERVRREAVGLPDGAIGHRVRFDASAGARGARLTFVTEGVLLREAAADPLLSQYDAIVIDELHERHVGTDLLLAVGRQLLLHRPRARLILMSATLDVAKVVSYLADALGEPPPVVRVPGRAFAVDVRHLGEGAGGGADGGGPREGGSGGPHAASAAAAAAVAAADAWRAAEAAAAGLGGDDDGADAPPIRPRRAAELLAPARWLGVLRHLDATVPPSERGDALAFLPGVREIDSLSAALQPYAASSGRWLLLSLHAGLSAAEQARAFAPAPAGVRKLVLATNVAETSVTIPAIRFVLDSGLCKQMRAADAPAAAAATRGGGGGARVAADGGARALELQWTSRAAAAQRAGRAGRTGPGVAFRFYDRAELDAMAAHAPPEIARAPAESVVLAILELGYAAPLESFPLLTPLPRARLRAATSALCAAGALEPARPEDGSGGDGGGVVRLTPLGRFLARLPLDPLAGRVAAVGAALGLGKSAAAIVGLLSVPSPLCALNAGDGASSALARARDVALGDRAQGDALCLLALRNAWLEAISARRDGDARTHAARGGGGGGGGERRAREGGVTSREWCRTRGLDEGRLYDAAQVEAQVARHLGRRLTDGGAAAGARAGARLDGGGVSGAELARLRAARDREARVRRPLQPGRSEGGELTGLVAPLEASAAGAAAADADSALRHATLLRGGEAALREAAAIASADEQLALRLAVFAACYPSVALARGANAGRPAAEQVLLTRDGAELCAHPSSVLATATDAAAHVLTPAGPDGAGEVVTYVTALRTSKAYALGLTPLYALPALLLCAAEVDVAADGSRVLIDDWLLLEVRDGGAAEPVAADDGALPPPPPPLFQALRAAHELRLALRLALSRVARAGEGDSIDAARDEPPAPRADGKRPRYDAAAARAAAYALGNGDSARAARAAAAEAAADATEAARAVAAHPHVDAPTLRALPDALAAIARAADPREHERAPAELRGALAAFLRERLPGSWVPRAVRATALASLLALPLADADELHAELVHAGADRAAVDAAVARRKAARGVPLAAWLRVGALRDARRKPAAASESQGAHGDDVVDDDAVDERRGMGEHLARRWSCPRCGERLIVTLPQLRAHQAGACGAEIVAEPA